LTGPAAYRLTSQCISAPAFKTAKEIVSHMGAIQAQDYAMAKWAIALRLKNHTDGHIEKAIDNAEIIRTHILRPTWHFVSAADVRWMLKLSAPHILKISASYNKRAGLDNKTLSKANSIIEKILEHKQLTRQEIMNELNKKNIRTDEFRSIHIMFNAELNGIVCNGSRREKQFTYALLDERVPNGKTYSREESLAELAKRYFTSHGPATVDDFKWWSGLTGADSKKALESVKQLFIMKKIADKEYWFSKNLKPFNKESLYFLPAFDEFMVSYKERSASISKEHFNAAMTGNGIFKPIIVKNGKVIGIWKRTIKRNDTKIDCTFFNPKLKLSKKEIEKATEPYRKFLDLKN